MNWAKEKINELGTQRMLQDIIDEMDQHREWYLQQLSENLSRTLKIYVDRNVEFSGEDNTGELG